MVAPVVVGGDIDAAADELLVCQQARGQSKSICFRLGARDEDTAPAQDMQGAEGLRAEDVLEGFAGVAAAAEAEKGWRVGIRGRGRGIVKSGFADFVAAGVEELGFGDVLLEPAQFLQGGGEVAACWEEVGEERVNAVAGTD